MLQCLEQKEQKAFEEAKEEWLGLKQFEQFLDKVEYDGEQAAYYLKEYKSLQGD